MIFKRFKFKDSHRKRLFFSYGKDWLLVLIMAIIFFAIDSIEPFHREFSISDTSIMHPYTANESVPVWLLMFVAIIIPILIIILYAGLFRKNWLDFNNGLLGLGLALTMTIMMTDVIKITVGRPRPDMLERCKPPPGIENPPLHLLNYTICTADPGSYDMIDGFKSFPSGHSSFSFAGLGYLAFYLAGKMHVFDRGGHTYKSFVCCVPFLGALLIAISRVRDYRHHWTDVFVGAIFGTVFAYFSYRQYYPCLADEHCQLPFPLRIRRPENIFPEENTLAADEEQTVGSDDLHQYSDYPNRSISSQHSSSNPSNSKHLDHGHLSSKHPNREDYAVNHIENQSTSNSNSS